MESKALKWWHVCSTHFYCNVSNNRYAIICSIQRDSDCHSDISKNVPDSMSTCSFFQYTVVNIKKLIVKVRIEYAKYIYI